VSLALSNTTGTPTHVKATLYSVTDIWDYRVEAGEPLAETELVVPAGGPHWVEWDIELPAAESTGYIRIDLQQAPDVMWHISPAVQPGLIAAYEDHPGHYRRFGSGQTLSFQVSPAQHGYEPTQVVSGEARPHRSTNQWRSDTSVPLPAWLQLDWDEPQELHQIQVTFPGHLLREYHAYPAFYRDPDTLRDYEIQVADGQAWRTLVRVEDNTATRVVHTLESPVVSNRLRLVALATNGGPAAGIYEIRAYASPVCTHPSYSGSEVSAS
jgi:hypothetical protein